MNCPYCGKEMTPGYIQCRDGVYWTPKKQLIAALSGFGRGYTPLENGDDGPTAVLAHKCADCKKVVIDYS